MKKIKIEIDILVFRIKAKSFPDGVLEVLQQLHSLIPFDKRRNYFGISRPENGKITYWAAAEELEKGELSTHHLESFTIKKGEYICMEINNFTKDVSLIGEAFSQLTSYPEIDPEGYCVEWYQTQNDVKCMVKLK